MAPSPPRMFDEGVINEVEAEGGSAFLKALLRMVNHKLAHGDLIPSQREFLLICMDRIIDTYHEAILAGGSKDRVSWDNRLGSLVSFAYCLGSFCPAPELEVRRTIVANTKRAGKNKDWVDAFEKAIREVHKTTDLEAQDAINKALESKSLNGVKIPVENEALRRRERELRTGKKRR